MVVLELLSLPTEVIFLVLSAAIDLGNADLEGDPLNHGSCDTVRAIRDTCRTFRSVIDDVWVPATTAAMEKLRRESLGNAVTSENFMFFAHITPSVSRRHR